MRKASSKVLLLDVNVLLALAWPNHQFHAKATRRLSETDDRWATCALTELAFIRLSSNPAAVSIAKSPAEAARLMRMMAADPLHTYLKSLPSPMVPGFRRYFDRVMGSKQVTDAYLLALARHHGATLLTFDSRLAVLGQDGAEAEVLSP